MPKRPIDLEAIRRADAKLKQLLADHPELREPTPERQAALEDWLTTLDEETAATLATDLQAAIATYLQDIAAAVPPVQRRVTLLLLALHRIATGEVKLREARVCAAQALALWQDHCAEEEADDGEDR